MTDSITPPPELLLQLHAQFHNGETLEATWAIAFQAGADQELRAVCEWVAEESIAAATELRAWRRPKPPSLKEEALKGFDTLAGIVLDEYHGTKFHEEYKKVVDTVLRALEALPE